MPWITTIDPSRAKGRLKKEYDKAIARADRIWHIVSLMSINPRALRRSMQFYDAIMHKKSPLSRGQREMLAVVVSAANQCPY